MYESNDNVTHYDKSVHEELGWHTVLTVNQIIDRNGQLYTYHNLISHD